MSGRDAAFLDHTVEPHAHGSFDRDDMVKGEWNIVNDLGEQWNVVNDDGCLGVLMLQSRRLGIDQWVLDGVEPFTCARRGVRAEDMIGNPWPVHSAIGEQCIRTELGDDLWQRHSPGFDDLMRQRIVVDMQRAELLELRRHRTFARGDAAGQSYSHHGAHDSWRSPRPAIADSSPQGGEPARVARLRGVIGG